MADCHTENGLISYHQTKKRVESDLWALGIPLVSRLRPKQGATLPPVTRVLGLPQILRQEQGVSVYTFRDERDLLWHSLVFSAADRESAYVIDGLMHNEVVKSDIHSTDAFGYTEAIFATSHLTGFSYAPRFKEPQASTALHLPQPAIRGSFGVEN